MTQRGETQQSLSAFPGSDLQVILTKKSAQWAQSCQASAWAGAWAQAEPAAGSVAAVSGSRSAQGLYFMWTGGQGLVPC